MAFLKIEDLKKNFGTLEVLKGVDLELEKGEVLAIIGSSGSGKTTLLRCINFLETPSNGRIYVDGDLIYDAKKDVKISDADLRKKRLNFGLVFQSFNLFPQYTVLRNVSLAPELLIKSELSEAKSDLKKALKKKIITRADYKNSLKQLKIDSAIRKKANDENAIDLLKRVGLSDKINGYPCELSGGQCQRVAIARALALNPKIICFDEPTSALDPELTGEVLKVIKSLKNSDNTMIVVTHEMEFARDVGDKIIFMADGKIEESGTPDEVFGSPNSDKTRSFLSKYINGRQGGE